MEAQSEGRARSKAAYQSNERKQMPAAIPEIEPLDETARWCDTRGAESRYQRQVNHRADKLAEALNIPAVSEEQKLAAEIAALEAKREAAEANKRRLASAWEQLHAIRAKIQKQLQHLTYLAECNTGHADSCLETLQTKTLRGLHHLDPYNRIDGAQMIATEHLAAKLLETQIPLARQAIEADLEQNASDIIQFAAENNLIDRLDDRWKARALAIQKKSNKK